MQGKGTRHIKYFVSLLPAARRAVSLHAAGSPVPGAGRTCARAPVARRHLERGGQQRAAVGACLYAPVRLLAPFIHYAL